MSENLVTVALPEKLYQQLENLAARKELTLTELIAQGLELSLHQSSFQKKWADLEKIVQEQGGLSIGENASEIVDSLRQTRQEIFAEDYADLY